MQLIKKERNSNLELFRVITMLLIVAHHYVVNSGLMQAMSENDLTTNSIFLYIFGMWGKTGINCFVLITGYFMCKSQATVKKFLKLLLEVWFYHVIIYSLFLVFNVVDFDPVLFVRSIVPISHVGDGFTTAFILFYLFIPFLNMLIQAMNKKQHLGLIILFLFIYSFWYMAPGFMVRYNYVTWFIILYFISSFIRLYPIEKFNGNTKLWVILTIFSVSISIISVFIFRYLNIFHPYYLVSDSNAFMAIITSVCAFMLFKDLKIKHSKFINMLGASTFGVLLIHANSDAMRQLLWVDTLENTTYFDNPYLWIHSIISVVGVFAICILIDQMRIRCLERPLFGSKWFNNFTDRVQNVLFSKFSI